MTHDPKSLGARCASCPIARNGNPHKPVCGIIPPNPLGIVVGDAPKKEDAEAARAFSGQTGEALADSFTKAGLGINSFIRLYAVACEPPAKKDWNHLSGAVESCRPYFVFQVKAYKHLPVLLMGKWAFQAWGGKAKATENARGFVRDMPLKETLHDERGSTGLQPETSQGMDGSGESGGEGDGGVAYED